MGASTLQPAYAAGGGSSEGSGKGGAVCAVGVERETSSPGDGNGRGAGRDMNDDGKIPKEDGKICRIESGEFGN